MCFFFVCLFVCFDHPLDAGCITKHLSSLGKKLVLFSRESRCFPRLRLGKHRDSRENKTNCFPREQSLSVYYSTLSGTYRYILKTKRTLGSPRRGIEKILTILISDNNDCTAGWSVSFHRGRKHCDPVANILFQTCQVCLTSCIIYCNMAIVVLFQ